MIQYVVMQCTQYGTTTFSRFCFWCCRLHSSTQIITFHEKFLFRIWQEENLTWWVVTKYFILRFYVKGFLSLYFFCRQLNIVTKFFFSKFQIWIRGSRDHYSKDLLSHHFQIFVIYRCEDCPTCQHHFFKFTNNSRYTLFPTETSP